MLLLSFVRIPVISLLAATFVACIISSETLISAEFIPRTQSKAPGPPLSPEAALKKFTVPAGFHVELVASEPDLQNPVAMAFDDRGRIFVTESFEYPRREPGPGRDRIKILEDTDHDGRVDKTTIFAEGLNIPSGIAIGHGGVWVANAPDLLFIEDTDGDDRADKQTVVVSGFGRDDVHEVPSGLSWGPDGCLYGLNGVFNPSHIEHDNQTFDFTCAMWRIDPRSRKFDLFCEGTSNPWGITFNQEGSPFISACVIDHLWHLTESAYYHRQGGPYPKHTWKAESIVEHQHQKAAYCGIEYVDTENYPKEYRDLLYMGNIHGTCVNVDRVERDGATYKGFPEEDFMTADDVWFMPVSQKVGPDGNLYVLDWYDRYHCYQDANADPEGVDRAHGRLYRVVYGDAKRKPPIDIGKQSNRQLVELLNSPNVFYRQRSQLELAERRVIESDRTITKTLFDMTLDGKKSEKSRMHAAWALAGSGVIDNASLVRWIECDQPLLRAWAVRTAGRQSGFAGVKKSPELVDRIVALARDRDPRVRVEVAIAIGKLDPHRVSETMIDVLAYSDEDAILPKVVWQNWYRFASEDQQKIAAAFSAIDRSKAEHLVAMAPRFANVWMEAIKPTLNTKGDQATLISVLNLAKKTFQAAPDDAADILATVIAKVQKNELRGDQLVAVLKQWFEQKENDDSKAFAESLKASAADDNENRSPWFMAIEQLRSIAGDSEAIARSERIVLDESASPELRRSTLIAASIHSHDVVGKALRSLLSNFRDGDKIDEQYRNTVLDLSIANPKDDEIKLLLDALPALPIGIQATIADRMSQRTSTALPLLGEIQALRLRKEIIGPNQLRSLASNSSKDVAAAVQKIWGTVNLKDSGERQRITSEMANFLRWDARGDAAKGVLVYDRICGQCHLLNGRGYEVGPNITNNGRGTFEQMVVSVFDPSLVIGEAYRSVTVATEDGRVINGLLVEKTDKSIVLKLQGNKLETIQSEDISEFKLSDKSLMPEGIESQLSRQELADLFALLSLEGPLDLKDNAVISGTPTNLHAK